MHNDHAEPMSSVDRAWLEMDSPDNPMVVNAVLEFDGPVDASKLCAEIVARMLRYPRFRQRIDHDRVPPNWVDYPGFTPAYHAHVVPLSRRRPNNAIRAAVEAQINQPLDHTLPLWRLFVFARHDHGATVLIRVHHAMADGIALVQMLMHCTDGELQAHPPTEAESRMPGHRRGPFGALIGRLQAFNQVADKVVDFARADLRHPEWIPAHLREAGSMLSTVAHVLALPDDNPPSLHGPLCGRRSVAWASGIPLAPIRSLASVAGAKVNDVFLAAVAGAFARFLAERGESLRAHQNLRVSVPVNLRPAESGALGNCFGLVLVDLPVGIRDWRKRLSVVTQRMDELKRSPTARTVLFALAAAGHLPVALETQLVGRVAGKSVAVVSNLRGPAKPMRLAGARIRDLIFWPPQAGRIGIGLSLFSYDRRVTIGISADHALIEHPDRMIAAFKEELAAMLAAGNLKPVTERERKPKAKSRLATPKTVAAGRGPDLRSRTA